MCGIAGLLYTEKALIHGGGGQQVNQVRIEDITGQMVHHLKHRGPDDQGASVTDFGKDGGEKCVVGIGHTRLAILDLSSAGHQPMGDAYGNQISFNGEIYNFKELRRQFDDSYEWKSQTDTEVLLHAYAKWGRDCLRHLRGMFALAIRDKTKQELFLARDPLGIKPLYYYNGDGVFIFASEVQAVLSSGLVPRRICRAGLVSYLQNGSVASPETMIEGVRLLSPGHYMVVKWRDDGGFDANEISYTEDLIGGATRSRLSTRQDAVRALREVLKESVRLHLASDVPLAPFLSGGIDSSAIVALMRQVTEERPKTFSVVFAEKKFSEAEHALQIAQKFDTEHHEIHLGKKQLFDMLPSAISAEDQPTMDGINTFVVSKAVKEAGITVALSGLGGDELFAGYPTFRRALRLQSAARFPSSLRQGVSAVGERLWNRSVQHKKLWQLLASDGSPAAACMVSRQLFSGDEVESLLSDKGDVLHTSNGNHKSMKGKYPLTDTINSVSLYELRGYMTNTLLRDTDCMSMAHSLEVRVPFVDVEVVRFMMELPGAWKVDDRQKPLLQDALGDLLPPAIMNRPKMGFTLPFEEWMQSSLRDEIGKTFADDSLSKAIGLEPEVVREVWQQFLRAPQRVGWSRPWALYVLLRW